MKKIRFIVFALLIVFALSVFAACNETPAGSNEKPTVHEQKTEFESDDVSHRHGCTGCNEHKYGEENHTLVDGIANKKCSVCGKVVAYTDEENALYWIAGRDGTSAWKGMFAIDFTEKVASESAKETEKIKSEFKESWNGSDKYFYDTVRYVAKGDAEYTLEYAKTEALKPMTVDGEAKWKWFASEMADGYPTKGASYVSSDYVNESRLHYAPYRQIEEYGVDDCTDYESLVTGIKAFSAEECMPEPTITLLRNTDGSVTLLIVYSIDMDMTNEESGENFHYTFDVALSLTAKDGKIVEIIDMISESSTYADSAKNYTSTTVRTKAISYEFNQSYFDSIDVTTDETFEN